MPDGRIERASSPSGSTTVAPSSLIQVSGWAIDQTDGSPVARVEIRIDNTPVGNANLGLSRPDVASAFNDPRYASSGWNFSYNIGNLPAGSHAVTAVAYNQAGMAGTLTPIAGVGQITVTSGSGSTPFGREENASSNGSTSVAPNSLIQVSGWAVDESDGSPVARVEIRIDNAPVGNANLGQSRPDVASALNDSRYAISGWNFAYNIGALAAGSHTVTAVAYNQAGTAGILTPVAGVGQIIVTSGSSTPFGREEGASSNGSTSVAPNSLIQVSGWAVDQTDGSPVARVEIRVDNTPVGNARLGLSRPDVASALNDSRFASSGWDFGYNIGNLAPGSHTVTAVAYNQAGKAGMLTPVPGVGQITVAGGGTCTPGSTNPSVTICQPQNGSTVASPVRIVAATTNSRPVTAMAIYVDNTLVYKDNVSSLDTSVNMAEGSHYIVVQAWDNTGAVTKASVNITVSAAAVPTISFISNPGLINSGQNSTLTWTTTGAASVTIDNGIGAVPLSGSQSVSPTATTTYTLTATGNGGSANASTTVSVSGSTGGSGITKINHIIFALQENRSFDSYFGMINKYRASLGLPPDVDAYTLNSSGVPTNSNPNYSRTGSVSVFHMQTMCTENLSPSWNESHVSANFTNPSSNTFLNDGFVWVAGHNARDTGGLDVNGLRAMGYYDNNDLPYYYFMASQFAMSDRWFSPAPANTNTNRHYVYAATSNGHAYPWTGAASTSPTIWDRLTAAGISWKVYVANFNSTVFYEFVNSSRYGDHIFPMQKYFDDLAAGTLPQVATLETAGLNEHPENNIQAGAAFMASAVNAFMGSQYWKDSAFILTYDEFGGLYDHVKPQLTNSPDGVKPIDLKSGDIQGDFTRTGFRVPFMVISPFARPHYVSHTVADHTAILKFIEKRFALQPLTARDAAQMDMTEFFDFNNPAWATPPSPPAQPQNGACYFDHLP